MRILVVCLGNICRSPTAAAALREAFDDAGLGDRVAVQSAGTGTWHLGDPPDPRMQAAARAVGLTIDGRARLVPDDAFDTFDLILCADRANLRTVLSAARDERDRAKVRLFREFEPDADAPEVPDPYYEGPEGFERVVEIARAGARGVVEHVLAHDLVRR